MATNSIYSSSPKQSVLSTEEGKPLPTSSFYCYRQENSPIKCLPSNSSTHPAVQVIGNFWETLPAGVPLTMIPPCDERLTHVNSQQPVFMYMNVPTPTLAGGSNNFSRETPATNLSPVLTQPLPYEFTSVAIQPNSVAPAGKPFVPQGIPPLESYADVA